MNNYYYEAKHGKGWFKAETDRKAIEHVRHWIATKVYREVAPSQIKLIHQQKR